MIRFMTSNNKVVIFTQILYAQLSLIQIGKKVEIVIEGIGINKGFTTHTGYRDLARDSLKQGWLVWVQVLLQPIS